MLGIAYTLLLLCLLEWEDESSPAQPVLPDWTVSGQVRLGSTLLHHIPGDQSCQPRPAPSCRAEPMRDSCLSTPELLSLLSTSGDGHFAWEKSPCAGLDPGQPQGMS